MTETVSNPDATATRRGPSLRGSPTGRPTAACATPTPTATSTVATALDVPAVLAEAGGQGPFPERDVLTLVDASRRVMQHLGMLPGTPTPRPTIAVERFVVLTSEHEGRWYPRVRLDPRVEAGEPLGEVHDPLGDVVQAVTAPASGPVLYYVATLVSDRGDPLVGIGATALPEGGAEPTVPRRSGAPSSARPPARRAPGPVRASHSGNLSVGGATVAHGRSETAAFGAVVVYGQSSGEPGRVPVDAPPRPRRCGAGAHACRARDQHGERGPDGLALSAQTA